MKAIKYLIIVVILSSTTLAYANTDTTVKTTIPTSATDSNFNSTSSNASNPNPKSSLDPSNNLNNTNPAQLEKNTDAPTLNKK